MNQNEIAEHTTTENVIFVNPIIDNTLHINDAVLSNDVFVDAVLITDSSNCMNVKQFIICIVTILILSFMLFSLFLFTGGIGIFLTIDGGDDAT